MSPAYTVNLNLVLALEISFIYIRNRIEPKIEPCVTPVFIGPKDEVEDLQNTAWYLFVI